MEEWIAQLQNSVNSLERLKEYINVTPEEEEGITTLHPVGYNSLFCFFDGPG